MSSKVKLIKHEKYKPADLLWLNSIPSHWEIKRVKDLAEYQSGEYINAMEFDEGNIYPVYGGNSFRGFANKYNTEGDYVMIGRQGALCGNVNYGSGKFWATEHCVVVYHKKKINVKWLGELLRVMNLNQYATSTAQPGLSVEKIKRLELPFVPFAEQVIITKYLDTKTQAIDKKINLLSKKANFYKELRKSIIKNAVFNGIEKNVKRKESKIEYVGEIPQHWEISRGKNLFIEYPKSKITANEGDEEGKYKFFTSSNEQSKWLNYFQMNSEAILFSTGGCAGVNYCQKEYSYSTDCWALYGRKNVHLKYYYYYFETILNEIQQKGFKGSSLEHLQKDFIKASEIIVPSTKLEQSIIAKYLDEKTQKIDAIVNNIGKQIETLKELRKTLINDVVTGKIKVTL